MRPNRFQAFKKALDGTNDNWGFVCGLTFEQARDVNRFPLGRQVEPDGRPFIWTYSLMAGVAS